MEIIRTVEIVRKIRDKQYILTKDFSDNDLILYFKNKAKKFNDDLLKGRIIEKQQTIQESKLDLIRMKK